MDLLGSKYDFRSTVRGRRVWKAVGDDPTKALKEESHKVNQLDGLELGIHTEESSGLHMLTLPGSPWQLPTGLEACSRPISTRGDPAPELPHGQLVTS